jgi:hypothetical protein
MGNVKEGRVLNAEGLEALGRALLYVEERKQATSTEVQKKWCDYVAKKPSQFQLSFEIFLRLE